MEGMNPLYELADYITKQSQNMTNIAIEYDATDLS